MNASHIFFAAALVSLVLLSGCFGFGVQPTITELPNGNTRYESPLQGGFSFEFGPGFEIADSEGLLFMSNDLFNMIMFSGPNDAPLILMLFSQEMNEDWNVGGMCNEESFREKWMNEQDGTQDMEIDSLETRSIGNIYACEVRMHGIEGDSIGTRGKMVMGKCRDKIPLMGIYFYEESQASDQTALENILSTFDC